MSVGIGLYNRSKRLFASYLVDVVLMVAVKYIPQSTSTTRGLGDCIMELKWQVIVSPSSGVGQSPSTIGGWNYGTKVADNSIAI